MKSPHIRLLGAALCLSAVSPLWAEASKVTSDLLPSNKRQETVDKATFLSRAPTPAPVPTDLPQPFNPAGFDAPDPSEAKANPASPARGSAGPSAPSGPTSDRELLETIASRIQPTGSFIIGGNALLTFPGAKRVRVGEVLTVTFQDHDYDLEVVAIDRTTFTLRYRGEEITRPIAKTTK